MDAKKAPPKLPGDKGYALDSWKRNVAMRRKARDAAAEGESELDVPAGMEKTMNEAEGVMSNLGIQPTAAGAPEGGAPEAAGSPEATAIAAAIGISPKMAQQVWDAAQARDDLRGASAEALAAKLQSDFGLLRSLLQDRGTPQTEAPPKAKETAGGPEIEPETEKAGTM